MNKLGLGIFLIFVFNLMILSAVKAEVLDSSMALTKTIYGIGEVIEGLANLSLSSEPVDNILAALGKNITLIEFLEKNGLQPEKDFYCNPVDCKEYYETSGSSRKQEILASGGIIIGGMIIGKQIEIKPSAIEFSMQGSGGAVSCGSSPLQIDLLSDGTIDWTYTGAGELCGSLKPSSCYDNSAASLDLDITTSPYCQKIFLPVSSRFKLSALVKKNKGGGDLAAFIYDKKTGNQAECDLPEPNATSYIEESCMVDLNVFSDTQEYYACIKDNSIDNAYTIKAEDSAPVCGYSGLPSATKNASADFALLAQGTGIAPINETIKFSEQEFFELGAISASESIQEYIEKRYANNCVEGCIVPIRIISSNGIIFKDFKLSYCAQGLCTTEQNFFELARKPAMVDMNLTRLDLSAANFSSDEYGEQVFGLFIGGRKIGEEKVSIERVPAIKNLIALNAEAGTTVDFFVEAYSPKNNSLVSYEWIFGDGASETSAANSVNHTYKKIGKFKVIVRVTDSQGLKGSKSFEIMVGSPKEILNITLKEKRILLGILKGGAMKAGWYKPLLEKQLGISENDALLTGYENQFKFSTADAEYIDLISKVQGFILPKSVYDSEFTAEMPVAVDVNSIKPELIEGLNGGVYDVNFAEEARNAIWYWQYKNIAMTAASRIVSVSDENDREEDIATIITLRIKPLALSNEVYAVILTPYENAVFASEYGQEDVAGNIGFVFNNMGASQVISFALAGRVDLSNLVVFASPYLSDLEIKEEVVCNSNRICEKELGENWRNCRADCKPVGLAIFLFVIVIVLMIIIYLLLQRWYKTRYEKYLFKNPQDLHNLISFVGNALRKGETEKDAKNKLKQAGWSIEQVNYVLKKIKGDKIGMPEVKLKPGLFKFSGLFKHRKV